MSGSVTTEGKNSNKELTFEEIKKREQMFAGLVVAGGEVVRYATRLKYYGDELAEVMMCSKAMFNPNGLCKCSSQHTGVPCDGGSKAKLTAAAAATADGDDTAGEDRLKRSKRRARKAVFDYAMCNPDLNLFITFTLDAEKIDRYDYKGIIKKLNTWLDNRVRRNGLKYVLVAEYHKDGAIHFHGLINENAVKIVDSGHTDKKGRTVYNVTDWRYGFSTAVKVYGARGGVCKYIVKYITKAGDKVGGRWYYSGGALQEPQYEYMGSTTPDDWAHLAGYESYTKCVDGTDIEYNILSKKY